MLRSTGLAVISTGARSLRLVASNAAEVQNYRGPQAIAPRPGRSSSEWCRRTPSSREYAAPRRLPAAQGRTDEALDLFRKAGQILRRPGVVGAPPEDILPWLDALQAAAERHPENRTQLTTEMFEAPSWPWGAGPHWTSRKRRLDLRREIPRLRRSFAITRKNRANSIRLRRNAMSHLANRPEPKELPQIDARIE